MADLVVSNTVRIPESEIQISAIRAQGAGGQNVNKVATAIHLRFDIRHSSLPDALKARLLQLNDSRISREGVLVIKAQTHRTQEKNRVDAQERLLQLVRSANHVQKKRRPTRPTLASKKRRLDSKNRRGAIKKGRGKVDY